MNLNYHTIIRPAARSDSIRDPEVVFTPPAECLAREFNTDYLVDVSGILTGLQPEYEFAKGNGTSSRMKIEMENRGYRFTVQLFGEYVAEVKKLVSSPEGNNAVLAFLWCKVDTWNGGRQLQTSMHTTRLLINPPIPETALLKETLSQVIASPALTLTQGSKSACQLDDFLKVNERHTILLAKEMLEVNNFVILASVDSIFNEDDWWYWACKCHKKVIEDADMYYCDKCNTHVTDVTKKYFLKLRIIDESDSVTVVVFDQVARLLIGRSADDVYDSWLQDSERDYVPTELLGLPGKQALWKIMIENYKGGRFPRQYLARNLTDDRSVIERYQLQWANPEQVVDAPREVLLLENTPTGDLDSTGKLSHGVSQDLIARFDQSASDSNSAVIDNETVDITKDIDNTPPLKRKSPAKGESCSATKPLKTVKVENKE